MQFWNDSGKYRANSKIVHFLSFLIFKNFDMNFWNLVLRLKGTHFPISSELNLGTFSFLNIVCYISSDEISIANKLDVSSNGATQRKYLWLASHRKHGWEIMEDVQHLHVQHVSPNDRLKFIGLIWPCQKLKYRAA